MSATAWQQQGWGAPPVPQQPMHQGAQQAWASPTHPGPKTNLLAMLAIGAAAAGTTVLLGLGSIAAIVLGCIALSQLRRTGEDGRLLAIWAPEAQSEDTFGAAVVRATDGFGDGTRGAVSGT